MKSHGFEIEAETNVSFQKAEACRWRKGLRAGVAQPAPDLDTSWAQALEAEISLC
jgi:hypothetical protein